MAEIDSKIIDQLERSITEGRELTGRPSENDNLKSDWHRAQSRAWIVSVLHLVQLFCPETNAYRINLEKFTAANVPYRKVVIISVTEILVKLHRDLKNGLFAEIGDLIRAETFVNFLDHGRAYLRDQRKSEAGTIIGVVFEDTIRRISEKNDIPQTGVHLESLISELQRKRILKSVEAKQARVAAHVRTKATHAQWDEFDLPNVEVALRFTEELISKHLE